MSTDSFASVMDELDAVVELCRGREPFVSSVIRDTSNRSNRDWPWWSIELQQTEEHDFEKRRVTATVTLNATQAGEPGSFRAEWLARVWRGVGIDTFFEKGGRSLTWGQPSTAQMQEAMASLLQEAKAAIVRAGFI
jgi:hypothetical protein